MSYSEIKSQLHDLPRTWYPALLQHLVEECIEQQVFRAGQIHVFVRKVEGEVERQAREQAGIRKNEGDAQ